MIRNDETITNGNTILEEIENGLNLNNVSYNSIQNPLFSRLMFEIAKSKI